MFRFAWIVLSFFAVLLSVSATALEPFSKQVSAKVGVFSAKGPWKVPVITWGADIVTVHANGGEATAKDSLFGRSNLSFQLFREDDFAKQTEAFLRGETPFLRGTMGMMVMAADVANRSEKTKLVVVYQHSWSAGGDALVVKGGVNDVSALKGKTIAIQKYGPHLDYMLKLLSDAGLKASDVKLVWTKDLAGPEGDTPMAKMLKGQADAAYVIIPDALALTSGGKVGTGAEDSVKGAQILLSTKTANRIISDVYAVRRDFFQAHRKEVKAFVHQLMLAEEEVRDLFKNPRAATYRPLMQASAKLLIGSEQAVGDVEGMYRDAEMAGYNGNVQFFTDPAYPRGFAKLASEVQGSFSALGLLTGGVVLDHAGWDYGEFRAGLKYGTATKASRFKPEQVSNVIARRAEQQTLGDSSLFSFEIHFKPNQDSFSPELYAQQFARVVDLASTYGGAVITVEGHADTMGFLRKQKDGAPQVELNQIKQSARNLSVNRANSVRDAVVLFGRNKNISLDPSQFATVGHGISSPRHALPKTKEEWLDNMRVEFRIVQVEAEESVFNPLD